MERDEDVPKANAEPGLTAERIARICGSLEPAVIRAGMFDVCSELVELSELKVFSFAEEDESQLSRFGDEDGSKISVVAPEVDGVLPFGPEGSPLPVAGTAAGRSHGALLSLVVDGEKVGILEASFDRKPTGPELETLATLSAVLAVAVRNARELEKTRRLTFTDDLTALYNSRFMRLYLDREIKRCRRTHASLSLLFMDLDGFKGVNDTHGHLAGSRTLTEVGEVLERTVRDADVLIRYGGDEFVILFPETALAGGLIIAERIRHAVGDTRFLSSMGIEARISASIGIAAYPESADDARTLISCADRAMYQAKALGKDRVVAASPLPSPDSL